MNLGTGNGISVLELVHAFENAKARYGSTLAIGPRCAGDLPMPSWADATKAKNLLGWEATHSVEDMCRSAWQFSRNSK